MKILSARKFAGILMVSGLVLGLIGSGVGASFSDSTTAKLSISVGTFGIVINSTTPNAVVTPTAPNGASVTYTCPDIESSAAGNCPLAFTITSTGTMPANITVAATAVAAPFADMLAPVAPYVLAGGGHTDFAGGISWGVLGMTDLGQSVSITYTITATA